MICVMTLNEMIFLISSLSGRSNLRRVAWAGIVSWLGLWLALADQYRSG
jgi:hypothetical protein